MCGCPSDRLCTLCREGRFAQLRGVAACRARRWVEDLARRIPHDHRWPDGSEKMIALAKHEVEDLARDPELLELLAKECEIAARKEWREATSEPA